MSRINIARYFGRAGIGQLARSERDHDHNQVLEIDGPRAFSGFFSVRGDGSVSVVPLGKGLIRFWAV